MTPWLDDGDVQMFHGDVVDVLRSLPAGIAQTCVTSPPFFGLRDYGVDGQIGLEASVDEYVARLVEVFGEVWRVLRPDGTCWIELGDSYNSGTNAARQSSEADHGAWSLGSSAGHRRFGVEGVKVKDLIGVPWLVAFALRDAGWYLRSDVVWSRPNPMPESVTDRPTKSHSYLFLLSKRPRYYMDMDAIREPNIVGDALERAPRHLGGHQADSPYDRGRVAGANGHNIGLNPAGRNRRSVWTIPTEPFPQAHFATYPQALVRPCILAGTSEHGECSSCGAPWIRETDGATHYEGDDGSRTRKTNMVGNGHGGSGRGPKNNLGEYISRTTGWRASCDCEPRCPHCRFTGRSGPSRTEPGRWWCDHCAAHFDAPTRPQTVLDPFIGSGTTALVARNHARRCIGIDLSAEYLQIAARRLQQLSLLGGPA